jgi:hypothetical protein
MASTGMTNSKPSNDHYHVDEGKASDWCQEDDTGDWYCATCGHEGPLSDGEIVGDGYTANWYCNGCLSLRCAVCQRPIDGDAQEEDGATMHRHCFY